MKKSKVLSFALAAFCAVQLMLAPANVKVSAAKAEFDAVDEALPAENRMASGAMDKEDALNRWAAKGQKLTFIEKSNGGYLECSNITVNHTGFIYTSAIPIEAGIYKFTGYFRTVYEGELTGLRLIFSDKNGDLPTIYAYPTSEEWLKVETYITLSADFKQLKVCGVGNKEFIQAYCMDNFSLVKVDAIPAGVTPATSFGTPVSASQAEASNNGSVIVIPKWDREKESQYEVQGVVINQDADSFITNAGSATEEGLKAFALGFEGSHVTDYMICVNNTNATFPSETWTDLPEKHTQTTENGQAVDYSNDDMTKSAYQHFIVKGLDYIKTWCETFPTIGINPWISFRMNDAHELSYTTSHLLSDYFHEHPEIRRVQHGVKVNSYYDYCQDYTHELVRDHMLDLINEALSRYDCYGIELDFQREIWLWYRGGEYNGLDILNDFMREVDRLVKLYEVKYGHDIKIGIRCASDIQTNYEFGLDIATWAAEGIIDMVSPTGRWSTTDNDQPVRLWTSIMHPYGVEVWPGIEGRIVTGGTTTVGSHSLETFAAAAANYLSQGADKVYLFNYYRQYSTALTEADRVSTTDTSIGVSSGKGYWNIISTIGSYDKLMTLNRRMILTYNDTNQIWKNSNKQLPKTVSKGTTAVLRIPVGDVPAGATVTLKLGVNNTSVQAKNPPTVYVNSELCTFAGTADCLDNYTTNDLLCYTIPVSAHDDMYVLAEIVPTQYITIDYAEVYVEVAKAQ